MTPQKLNHIPDEIIHDFCVKKTFYVEKNVFRC